MPCHSCRTWLLVIGSVANEEYQWTLEWLSLCQRDGGPTGVLLSTDNEILAAGMVERTQVVDIEIGRRSPDLVDVWFGGRPGPVSLSMTQSDYHALLARLVEAQEKQQWIWYYRQGGSIVEVVPEEDGHIAVESR